MIYTIMIILRTLFERLGCVVNLEDSFWPFPAIRGVCVIVPQGESQRPTHTLQEFKSDG